MKDNRKYAQDKDLLNLQLKESLRREMVAEQQRRALIEN